MIPANEGNGELSLGEGGPTGEEEFLLPIPDIVTHIIPSGYTRTY
jgi:hypothetical protein